MEKQLEELHKKLCSAAFKINSMLTRRKISKSSLHEIEGILKKVSNDLDLLIYN